VWGNVNRRPTRFGGAVRNVFPTGPRSAARTGDRRLTCSIDLAVARNIKAHKDIRKGDERFRNPSLLYERAMRERQRTQGLLGSYKKNEEVVRRVPDYNLRGRARDKKLRTGSPGARGAERGTAKNLRPPKKGRGKGWGFAETARVRRSK